MKIIKKGEPKANRVWQGECDECGSVMEALEAELAVIKSQRDGDWANAVCPVCKSSFILHPVKKG